MALRDDDIFEALEEGEPDEVGAALEPEPEPAAEPLAAPVSIAIPEEDWTTPLIVPEGEEPIEDLAPKRADELPTAPAPVYEPPPPPPMSWGEKLRRHTPTQMGVACLCGAVVLGYLQFGGEETPKGPPRWAPEAQGGFPKVEVDGLDRVVTHEDIRRVLDSVAPDEPPAPPPQEVRSAELVRAQPGVLYAGDGTVGDTRPVIAGSVEETRRMRAEEARQAQMPRARTPAQAAPIPPREETAQDRLDRNAHLLYEPGGTLKIEGVTDQGSDPVLRLEVGATFEVQLVVGVSSLAPNVVVARTTKAVKDNRGRQVLTKGAVLRGRAQGERDRLFLTFRTAKSRGETYRLEGYAVDKDMPGVRAIVRGASAEDRGRSGAGRGALGAAGGVVGEIVGQSMPGRVVRGIADGVVPEAQESLRADRHTVLELPVGRKFQVVVTGDGS